MNARSTPTEFLRYETKYLVPDALRQELEAALQQFMRLDSRVISEDRYPVRSLYYGASGDTNHSPSPWPALRFRVRTYSHAPGADTPAYLEIKERRQRHSFKRRAALGRIDHEDPTMTLITGVAGDTVKETFFQHFHLYHLRPLALIDYLRKPYISKDDPDCRLTFDDRIYATKSRHLVPQANENPVPFFAGHSIMELKCQHAAPAWFDNIVQRFALRSEAISKIHTGLEAIAWQEQRVGSRAFGRIIGQTKTSS